MSYKKLPYTIGKRLVKTGSKSVEKPESYTIKTESWDFPRGKMAILIIISDTSVFSIHVDDFSHTNFKLVEHPLNLDGFRSNLHSSFWESLTTNSRAARLEIFSFAPFI